MRQPTFKAFTPAEDDTLQALRTKGFSYQEIGSAMGRTGAALICRMSYLRSRARQGLKPAYHGLAPAPTPKIRAGGAGDEVSRGGENVFVGTAMRAQPLGVAARVSPDGEGGWQVHVRRADQTVWRRYFPCDLHSGVWSTRALADAVATILRQPKRKSRPCMTCRQTFESEGPHNRMCAPCRLSKESITEHRVAR